MRTYKYAVGMDEDGHFFAAQLNEREKILDFLQRRLVGEGWANRQNEEEFPEDTDFIHLSEEDWYTFLSDFIQRGHFELID